MIFASERIVGSTSLSLFSLILHEMWTEKLMAALWKHPKTWTSGFMLAKGTSDLFQHIAVPMLTEGKWKPADLRREILGGVASLSWAVEWKTLKGSLSVAFLLFPTRFPHYLVAEMHKTQNQNAWWTPIKTMRCCDASASWVTSKISVGAEGDPKKMIPKWDFSLPVNEYFLKRSLCGFLKVP